MDKYGNADNAIDIEVRVNGEVMVVSRVVTDEWRDDIWLQYLDNIRTGYNNIIKRQKEEVKR